MSPDSFLQWRTVVGAAFMTIFVYGIYAGYSVRSRVQRLRKLGLPMPEWSWIGGHLPILQQWLQQYPSNTFINVVIKDAVAREFEDTEMFYLDLWPFLSPNLVVCSPEAAQQASNKYNLPKPPMYSAMFDPMMGGPSILTMNGKEWKYWRSLFNPGFAPSYQLNQVPDIVDYVDEFCRQLRERKGTVFRLEDVATRLTMDIIMKVTLDLDLNYQRSAHPLADALRTMISWTSFGNPFNKYHPIRPFVLRYYGNVMNRLIKEELDKRFEEYTEGKSGSAELTKKPSKSVIALVLASYISDRQNKNQDGEHIKLDEHFIAYATQQIRLFLFAGHDTTTGVLVYVYHMLDKHPDILDRVRQELSGVFGPDSSIIADRLRQDPSLLNQTPYILAVIKETMRMYTPAGAYRDGAPGVSLTDTHGTQYPTEGCIISLVHHAIHYNKRVWPRAEDFLPERWLVEPGHALYPPPGAFRSFEQGPRNCIGQNLSLMELRIVLIMTASTFRVKPAYEEWDKIKPRGVMDGLLRVVGIGEEQKLRTIDGDRAYQIEKGGAHPAEGYPCRVEEITIQ